MIPETLTGAAFWLPLIFVMLMGAAMLAFDEPLQVGVHELRHFSFSLLAVKGEDYIHTLLGQCQYRVFAQTTAAASY